MLEAHAVVFMLYSIPKNSPYRIITEIRTLLDPVSFFKGMIVMVYKDRLMQNKRLSFWSVGTK